jgi:hypothetical protein
MSIPPFGDQPGLQVFECRKCGHSASVLLENVRPRGRQ